MEPRHAQQDRLGQALPLRNRTCVWAGDSTTSMMSAPSLMVVDTVDQIIKSTAIVERVRVQLSTPICEVSWFCSAMSLVLRPAMRRSNSSLSMVSSSKPVCNAVRMVSCAANAFGFVWLCPNILTSDQSFGRCARVAFGLSVYRLFPWPRLTGPRDSDIPNSVIMALAIRVACWMSLCAPVVISSKIISSAARPPM